MFHSFLLVFTGLGWISWLFGFGWCFSSYSGVCVPNSMSKGCRYFGCLDPLMSFDILERMRTSSCSTEQPNSVLRMLGFREQGEIEPVAWRVEFGFLWMFRTHDWLNSNCLSCAYHCIHSDLCRVILNCQKIGRRKKEYEARCQHQMHRGCRQCQKIEKERPVVLNLLWNASLVIKITPRSVLCIQDLGPNFKVRWIFYQWQLGQTYWKWPERLISKVL